MGATRITSVSQAMNIMKALGDQSVFHDAAYQQESRQAVAHVPRGRLEARVSAHLDDCRARGIRRNGSYPRRMLTGVGDLELQMPRTRHYSPVEILRAYARRAPEIDRLILACFVLGPSTRKVGKALLRHLGESVSASTVSQVAKQLDTEVAAFHRRPLSDRYRAVSPARAMGKRPHRRAARKRPFRGR